MIESPRMGSSKTSSFLSRVDFRKVIHQRSNHKTVQLKLEDALKHMKKDGDVTPEGSLKKMFTIHSRNRTQGDESLPSKMRFSVKLSSEGKSKEISPKKTMKWFDRLAAGKRQAKEMMASQQKSIKCKTQQDEKIFVDSKLNELKLQTIKKEKQHIRSLKSLKQDESKIRISAPTDKIRLIDEKLNNIIERRLGQLAENTHSSKDMTASVIRFSKESLNEDLRAFIQEIKLMKDKDNDGSGYLDKKIGLIQTLIAEQITQGELMKRYYFNVSSRKSRTKIGDFDHLRNKVLSAFRNFSEYSRQMKTSVSNSPRDKPNKPLFSGTTNNEYYKQPQSGDYEAFRFKHKSFEVNPQPFPRSSYKRQFLMLKSLPNEKVVTHDNSPYFPTNHSPVSSSYNYDYKSFKGQIFDHKQLDAYRDKLKTLKVSYMPKSKVDNQKEDRPSYYQVNNRQSSPVQQFKLTSQTEHSFNKYMLVSEAKRSFVGEGQPDRSRIKHQQLKEFEYRLKNMYKA